MPSDRQFFLSSLDFCVIVIVVVWSLNKKEKNILKTLNIGGELAIFGFVLAGGKSSTFWRVGNQPRQLANSCFLQIPCCIITHICKELCLIRNISGVVDSNEAGEIHLQTLIQSEVFTQKWPPIVGIQIIIKIHP